MQVQAFKVYFRAIVVCFVFEHEFQFFFASVGGLHFREPKISDWLSSAGGRALPFVYRVLKLDMKKSRQQRFDCIVTNTHSANFTQLVALCIINAHTLMETKIFDSSLTELFMLPVKQKSVFNTLKSH